MSEYGMQLWNSSGELIFSSLKKTVQTIATGTITITNMNAMNVQFTPTIELPELWIGGNGYVIAQGYAQNYSRLFRMGAGKFVKNANGQYYQFTLQPIPFATLPTPPSGVGGQTPFPWTIPWVVFI